MTIFIGVLAFVSTALWLTRVDTKILKAAVGKTREEARMDISSGLSSYLKDVLALALESITFFATSLIAISTLATNTGSQAASVILLVGVLVVILLRSNIPSGFPKEGALQLTRLQKVAFAIFRAVYTYQCLYLWYLFSLKAGILR